VKTRIELLSLLVVIGLLFVLILIPGMVMSKARSQRINCANNLRQMTLAFKTWALDREDTFPMNLGTNRGGTKEYVPEGPAFKHFQALSNEFANPRILICPSDTRRPALNITGLSNSNLSYFIGLDVQDTNPQMFLIGDRNLTNGPLPLNHILTLNTNFPAAWTRELHRYQGNVGLADGSVQQFSSNALNATIGGLAYSNRLAFP
jgi:hypothetical protein